MAATAMTAPTGTTWRGAPGFTLVEMLVVLLLLGIVASIALPAYNEQVRRSHRAEARTALLQVAHQLERQATAAGTYPDGDLPQALASVPGGRYRVSRQKPTDATDGALRFVLLATPLGAQADDRCGTFTLSNTGERGLRDNQAKVSDCWNR